MATSRGQSLQVGGRSVRVSNLDKVLYPATGTTKGEVIDYYRQIAPVLLPGLVGRPVTRLRWPNGVDQASFFTKDLDAGTPDWVERIQVEHSGDRAGDVATYPLITTDAALAWLGQMAAIELHVPQWRITDPVPVEPTHRSVWPADRVVIDLDPGPGTGLAECARVAREIRDRLGILGERMVPVTSGSKGLHLYVPMDPPIPSAAAAEWARTIAGTLVKDMPRLVTATMTRAVRAGKVFLDWSQNNGAKTTIAPYSLRGREQPTVAAPRAWDELDDPDLRHLTFRQVLDRVAAGLNPAATLNIPPAPAPPEPPPAPTVTVAAKSVQSAAPSVQSAAPSVQSAAPPATNGGQRLVEGLAGPVTVALAKARDDIPAARALPGGCVYELKWDGYRAAIVIDHRRARIWSRQGTDLTDKFPEITAPAAQLPAGTVLDGELVIYNGARLDFDLLQRRMATRPAKIDDLVRAHPASFMVFDLLATDGLDLRARPFTERRHQLEHVTDWAPPLQLSPTTTDRDEAVRWMELYRPAGIEGIISKGQSSPYRPGVRDWIKTKSRHTEEVIVGGVLGPIRQPDVVIAGLYRDGQLIMVGRTVPLTAEQSRSLGEVLQPAGPDHPWPDQISSTRWSRNRSKQALTKVEPTVVVEVAADTGRQAGVWRHPLRYLRFRADLPAADLPALP